jgi:hypothetical protein
MSLFRAPFFKIRDHPRCVERPEQCRENSGMKHETRFEIRLRTAERQELSALAIEAGLSSADLARLGIKWLLAHRNVVLGGVLAGEAARSER